MANVGNLPCIGCATLQLEGADCCKNNKKGTCTKGACVVNGNVACDPVITGFDGQVFEFHSTGDFSLLVTEDWKVG